MKDNRFRKRTNEEKQLISERTKEGIANARNRGIPLGRPAIARLAIEESKHMITLLKLNGIPSNEIAEKLNVSEGALSENGFRNI